MKKHIGACYFLHLLTKSDVNDFEIFIYIHFTVPGILKVAINFVIKVCGKRLLKETF